MAAKLNQIIAIEKGTKSSTDRKVSDVYHVIQRTPLFNGLTRVYQPKDDEGEQLPPENQKVQLTAKQAIDDLTTALTKLFDVTFEKDRTNAVARANVVVDGQTLLSGVPVPYLLFLEKQLVNVHTFVGKLPTLDPTAHWSLDPNDGLYKAAEVQTTRTKKVPRNHVLAEATQHHPAQVQVYHEDVIVGTYTKTDLSGALPPTRVAELLTRVEKLQAAVKFARESANETPVVEGKAGEAIFSYLFA